VPPFTPFPMFAPYDHWWPNQDSRFPENDHVRQRLSAVDQASKPFINLWYCDRYLRWVAHAWTPDTASDLYTMETSALMQMLNWSFSNGTSLIDWNLEDIEAYIAHVSAPPETWVGVSSVKRFIPTPSEFSEWLINPQWRPYKFGAGAVRNRISNFQRRGNKFFDFYRKEVGLNGARIKVLNHKSLTIDSKMLFTRDEMDWCLKEIGRMELPELKRNIISTYIAIALYCKGPERKVAGSLKHNAMLNQFFKKKGVWYESLGKADACLPPAFTRIFEDYLDCLNINVNQPLPEQILFPIDAQFYRRWAAFRIALSERANTSLNQQVKNTHYKWDQLSFKRIRLSFFESKTRSRPRNNSESRLHALLRANNYY